MLGLGGTWSERWSIPQRYPSLSLRGDLRQYRGVNMTYVRAQEFPTLTQGTNIVNKYPTKFNHLTRYASEIANTEKGWINKFVYGLNLAIAWEVMIKAQPP